MADGTRRALVTGIGVISPLGPDRAAFAEGVLAGRSGIAEIRAFDPAPFRTRFGGEVRDFDAAHALSGEEIELLPDPYLRLALAAARDALRDAGLAWSRARPPERAAIVVGTCNGGLKTAEEQYEILHGMRPGRFDRRMNAVIRYHTLGKALAYFLGVRGPVWVVTTACSSSTAALVLALQLIQRKAVDTVLAGGADSLCLAAMAGFDSLKATSTERAAPFSLPVGLNLGEGAAFWVLEEERRARTRGAKVEGELLGGALTADAHHPTAPDPRGDGAYRTLAAALERSGASLAEIGCINAHGTGTEVNDRTESRAAARFMGERSIPVHSFKSQVGHCLGAAGILEATAGILAMQAGVIPATINFGEPRPGCNLDYVPNTPRPARYDRFISCNFAFGGNNAGVVVGAHDPARSPARGPDPAARTVLTGGGTVTSLGLGAEATLAALRAGRRGLRPMGERVTAPTRARLAGLVPGFTERDVDRRLDFRSMAPIGRFATAAARLALQHAGLRVGPREGLETGVVNGVYVGPSEESQMLAVIPSRGARSDIQAFSQIVANATAGWVSSALLLKGFTTTVSQGADAGLFALTAAHMAIGDRSVARVLAGASDELYSRYLRNYDELGLLFAGADEEAYGIRLAAQAERVLGEGAAYVVAEELDTAAARGARPIAEVAGFGMTCDIDALYEPALAPDGLAAAVDQALAAARLEARDVGLVLWSPQGNRGDLRVLAALELALGGRGTTVPLATTVFHTGLSEAASGTATLAAVLAAWAEGGPLWPQITGLAEVDRRDLPAGPVPLLALATSDIGFNLALALVPGGAL